MSSDLIGLRDLRDFPVKNVDPLSLSSKDLVALACAVARVGALLCDVGQRATPFHQLGDPPYIWDIKED